MLVTSSEEIPLEELLRAASFTPSRNETARASPYEFRGTLPI
jgi:hypothetical protein